MNFTLLINLNKKIKRVNYLEAFGEENYLKKFLNELALNKNLIDNK